MNYVPTDKSLELIFISGEDMILDEIELLCFTADSPNFRRKYQPKKEKKNKKYATKPKNNNKIAKIKASRYNRS
jgi:hypothetical protein